MRKIFCDWCGEETSLFILSVKRSRRIALTSNSDKHRLNVVVELEGVDEPVPQDLCRKCVSGVLKRAAEVLHGENDDNPDL
jgi:hypothetical protein